MKGFITGSHAYGKPSSDSDVDIVMMFEDIEEAGKLQDNADTKEIPFMFGKLNIIMCVDWKDYNIWSDGTSELIRRFRKTGVPIGKEEAREFFNKLRDEASRNDNYRG